jgi:response regulator of citrate/malate metabolism
MVESLDVIIVDDDPAICEVISIMIKLFYTWGQVYAFSKTEEAVAFCLNKKSSVAIFVLDVFLGDETDSVFLAIVIRLWLTR